MPTVVEFTEVDVTVETDPTVTVVEVDNAQPVVEMSPETVTVVLGTGASLTGELDMESGRILGRVQPGFGEVEQLTSAEATTLIDIFTPTLKGLVPPPDGVPDEYVLSATGEWIEGGGGGSVTDVEGDEINITVDDTIPEAPVVKMFDMPDATVKGRAEGAGTGQPTNLGIDELRALLHLGSFTEVRGAAFIGFNTTIALPANDVPITIKEDCTIRKVVVLTRGGDELPGECVIDIWKQDFGDYPPDETDSICSGGIKPQIASGQVKYQDDVLTSWNTAVSEGDVLMFHLESVERFTAVFVFLLLEAVGSTEQDGYTDERCREIVLEELADFDFSLYIPTSVPAVPDTIPMRDGDAYMYSETPPDGDSTEKVATTEFVNRGSSIGANGYMIHPSGLIEQWGYDTRTGSTAQTITFPIPFPNAIFGAWATAQRSSGDALGQAPTVIGAPGLADFDLAHADSSMGSFWHAKGN